MNDIQSRYGAGDLHSTGPCGDLRARMSQPGVGDARPGMGEMHRNAEAVLAGHHEVEVNGVRFYRDALGGTGMRSGPDLRALLATPQVAAPVPPQAPPQVTASPSPGSVEAVAAAMLARIRGEPHE